MTRYPNPFAAFVGSIAKAFATLGDRDNTGWRRTLAAVPSRSRARQLSRTPTPQAEVTSPSDSAEQSARPLEKSETMQRRRHTGAR